MKQRLKQLLLWIRLIPAYIYDFFIKIKYYFEEFPEKTNSRSDLSSTNVNVRRLKSGCRDKNVQTIALLGDFGSGKSSIVFSSVNKKRTLYIYPNQDFYPNNYELKKLFLNCLTKNDVLSISSQQDTYCKYIKTKKIIKLYFVSFFSCFMVLTFLAFLFKKYNDMIKEFMINVFEIDIKNYWYFIIPIVIFFFICIIGTIFICNYSITFKLRGIEAKPKKEEINDNSKEDSEFACIIFHLLRRKIKYIVFEDLDRRLIVTNQNDNKEEKWTLSSFRSLRDFCLRINASPKIKKSIKFIYCFSDKIFDTSDERLKSFDLIIPIYPKITMNNSYEILCKQDIIIDKKILNNHLVHLSHYITNQRLYNSIIYEFRLMCSQSSITEYDEMFTLCCIKNIYPKLFHELYISNNFIDLFFQKINGDISNLNVFTDDLKSKISSIFSSPNSLEEENAFLLIKMCINEKLLTSNYKRIIHGSKNFLSEEDFNYLRHNEAMEQCDANAKLSNYELILERANYLDNPNYFNISLLKYCIANNKALFLNKIIKSLMSVQSRNAIQSIIESNEITEQEIDFLTQRLKDNQLYKEMVFNSKNNNFFHSLVRIYLNNPNYNIKTLSNNSQEKIKYFYYNYPSYFVKLDTNLCLFVLQNFAGTFKEIPMIEDSFKRQQIYKCIVDYNRCDMTLENLKCLYDDFENSPLHHIIGDQKLIECIAKQNNIDVIKDLNKGEDSIDDLINLFKSTKINYSLLCRSNYIKCYKYSIDVEEKYYGFLETLLQFDILKFSSFNIANCDELINKENKKIEIGAFISRALDDNVPFDSSSKEKFSLELSSHLIMVLPKQYLSVIKDNIDTSIFNDVSNLKVIDIDKIKLFENDINLSKDVLVNMLDDNPQELKIILNECNAITIDKSNHSFDKERLEIAKKLKLNTIYGLFR